MKYIVQMTSGSYSDFGLNEVLVGDTDPKAIIDAFVARASEGVWESQDAMDRDVACLHSHPSADMSKIKLRSKLRAGVLQSLKDAGFVEHEYFEFWTGG